MKPLFRMHQVTYEYPGQIQGLKEIDLEIQHPSRVAFIGCIGSGKSTLLKILDGLYFPTTGSLAFDGTPLTPELLTEESFFYPFRRRVGFLFQDPEVQLFSPTVWDEICFAPLQLQWEPEKVHNAAEQIMKEFELEPLRDCPPFRLSLGEKKKVALAAVLILDPEVLLLDEPTAALDLRTKSMLLELLQQWGERNKTIITSTHDLTILKEVCDQAYVLKNGRIVQKDTPESVLKNEQLLKETNLIDTQRHGLMEHGLPHLQDFHVHNHES